MIYRRTTEFWRRVIIAGAVVGSGFLVGCAAKPIPPLAAGAPPVGVVRSKTGVLVSVLSTFDGGTWVRTPCYGVTVLHEVTPVRAIDVLLDPGHGGTEDGAVGPNGLKEKDLNLAIATRVKQRLEAKGRSVAMTRDGDIREPIRTRTDLAMGLKPRAFVSIHHNASGPPPRTGRPGTEVFHQATSEASRLLARKLWEAETAALSRFPIAWSADDNDPGPKFRIGENGDYYGVLRYTEGIPAVISEAAFVTSPAEAELMMTDAFRDTEADAIAGAIDTYLAAPAPTGTIALDPPATPTSSQSATTDSTDGRAAGDSTVPGEAATSGTASPASIIPDSVTTSTKAEAASTSTTTDSPSTTVGLPARPPDLEDCTDPPLE